MKIISIETFLVPPRWLFVKIQTDAGITGWGEPVLEGYALTVQTAIHEFSRHLIGQDPANINDIWQVLYRSNFYRGGGILMSAIAGIEQALWDIKGKYLGMPVYQLLGGKVRDKMKVYCWVGGDRPAEIIKSIENRIQQGFDVFKLNACEEILPLQSTKVIDSTIEKFAEIRTHFNTTIDFAVDFHGRVSAPMAAVLIKELELYKPLFIEEPVLVEQAEYYPRLAAKTHIPLAVGERSFSKFEFKNILANGGISIVQPDLSHAGGISECYKIGAMAEAHDVVLAPHCPLGPIALAACLAVDFVTWNAGIQETSLGIHYNQGGEVIDYVLNKEDFAIKNGYINPLSKPGLGVVIDEELVVARSITPHNWHNPLWRHKDGSVAEW